MQSQAATVDQYLQEVPEDRRQALQQLRAVCREELKGFDEVMEWGMPVYKSGERHVAFASQKRNIALYGMSEPVITRHKAELKGCSLGKGCIRYKSPEKIDFELVRTMIRENLAVL